VAILKINNPFFGDFASLFFASVPLLFASSKNSGTPYPACLSGQCILAKNILNCVNFLTENIFKVTIKKTMQISDIHIEWARHHPHSVRRFTYSIYCIYCIDIKEICMAFLAV
jgi:hypothetical protein